MSETCLKQVPGTVQQRFPRTKPLIDLSNIALSAESLKSMIRRSEALFFSSEAHHFFLR
jgi:hypothetical protein